MPQYRNISGEELWVSVDTSLQRIGVGEILTLTDEFCARTYVQTGDTGETPLWEAVSNSKKSTTTAAPVAQTEEK